MKREKWNSLTYKIKFSILLTNSIVAKIFKLIVFFFSIFESYNSYLMRYDIEPLKFDQGNRVQFIYAQGFACVGSERKWKKKTLTFAFGFALGLVTRVFPCIFICVLYLHQMCEPFFPVHVLRRIRPNKCCKKTEKFSKFCLHHSNLSLSLENGRKKSVSQISQESKLRTKD